MKTLVVPTIRQESIKNFIKQWDLRQWDQIIIVEDNPKPTFHLDINYEHLSWQDINDDLGDNSWIISKKDSGIRSYGFLKAYRDGADYVFTLDDDCEPISTKADHCENHIANMESVSKWSESVAYQRTRGLPYENKGKLNSVVMSVGLWVGVPDFDSIQSLSAPVPSNFQPPEYTRLLANGQYTPICGMNLAFKREATPLCYFPLMGMNSPYNRFDDIWFGILAKKICDHLRLHISCGMPFIYHDRHSNPFVNLQKEAPGIAFNEQFWTIIDEIELHSKTIRDCVKEIAKSLLQSNNTYVSQLGSALYIWEGLFDV